MQTIDWYDMVKWCNARSAEGGADAVLTTRIRGWAVVYKTGQVAPYVNWGANGYRLPTEAEWEKAARGGLSGQRFPWGNTITESQANYYSCYCYSYDLSNTGWNPAFNDGVYPYTSPVGSFAANGYGLYDMAGNVFQWCWDWYSSTYYSSSPGSDPQGPISGSGRLLRGGIWDDNATGSRCASRYYYSPSYAYNCFGFRCVRGF